MKIDEKPNAEFLNGKIFDTIKIYGVTSKYNTVTLGGNQLTVESKFENNVINIELMHF